MAPITQPRAWRGVFFWPRVLMVFSLPVIFEARCCVLMTILSSFPCTIQADTHPPTFFFSVCLPRIHPPIHPYHTTPYMPYTTYHVHALSQWSRVHCTFMLLSLMPVRGSFLRTYVRNHVTIAIKEIHMQNVHRSLQETGMKSKDRPAYVRSVHHLSGLEVPSLDEVTGKKNTD